MVSPICHWDDIETVQALVRERKAAGAEAHASCGIHVHVGLGEHTPKTLRNLHSVFQKGTIEFRAFNSTLHAGKVKAYIQLCLAISYQALPGNSAWRLAS